MISNYDIEARQLSIDKQRQWCNIYTLLRTVILFSCLPSFHLFLTTGKWKILPLIDKILCNGIWTKKSWRGNNQLFYLYPSFFERYCVKRKYLYWPLNDRIKRMIWSEKMAHSTLKNNEKHVYFHIGFQYKSINTDEYYNCDWILKIFKRLSIHKSIQTNYITKFHYSVVSFHSFNHSSYNLHIHTQLKWIEQGGYNKGKHVYSLNLAQLGMEIATILKWHIT